MWKLIYPDERLSQHRCNLKIFTTICICWMLKFCRFKGRLHFVMVNKLYSPPKFFHMMLASRFTYFDLFQQKDWCKLVFHTHDEHMLGDVFISVTTSTNLNTKTYRFLRFLLLKILIYGQSLANFLWDHKNGTNEDIFCHI